MKRNRALPEDAHIAIVGTMPDDEPILFDATLRPSPPMPARALQRILLIVLGVNLFFGVGFALKGAWMVTPFMGLDVLLLAIAFHASRRAAERNERVTLTPSQLIVERNIPQRPPQHVALNPYWVRLFMADPPEHDSQLELWSHGKRVRLGTFLAPEDRQSLAKRLRSALRDAREWRG